VQELLQKKEYFVNQIWEHLQCITYQWKPVPELDKKAPKVLNTHTYTYTYTHTLAVHADVL
jgi:hypothetical protein